MLQISYAFGEHQAMQFSRTFTTFAKTLNTHISPNITACAGLLVSQCVSAESLPKHQTRARSRCKHTHFGTH